MRVELIYQLSVCYAPYLNMLLMDKYYGSSKLQLHQSFSLIAIPFRTLAVDPEIKIEYFRDPPEQRLMPYRQD